MGTLFSAANQFFAGGTIVQRDANGRAVSPATADVSGLPAFMVVNSGATYDNRTNTTQIPNTGLDDGALVEGTFGSHAFAFVGATPIEGQPLFVVDNQTLSVDSLNGTRGPAGICVQVQVLSAALTKVYCLFGPVGLASAGALGTSHSRLALNILSAIVVSTGAPMAVFANGATTVPGVQMGDGSKSAVVRWNNDAAPGAIAINVPYPADLDDTQDVHFYALVSKSGATAGDATSLTVAAFEVVPGALADADVDFGGASTAIAGTAAAKTVTQVALTLTAANVHPYPAALNLQIKPTAGLLGTDDLLLHAAWIEFTRKAA
jgi:hypothetical protein